MLDKRISQLSLATISTVRAVVRLRSHTKAARELGVSQPAVSQHVTRFERAIGEPLLLREGNALIVRTDGMIDTLDSIMEGVSELQSILFQGLDRGITIRIGVCQDAMDFFVRRQFPSMASSMRWKVVCSSSLIISELFESGKIDIAFCATYSSDIESGRVDFGLKFKMKWFSSQEGEKRGHQILMGRKRSIHHVMVKRWLAGSNLPFSSSVEFESFKSGIVYARDTSGWIALPSFAEDFALENHLYHSEVYPEISDYCFGMEFRRKHVTYSDAAVIFQALVDLDSLPHTVN